MSAMTCFPPARLTLTLLLCLLLPPAVAQTLPDAGALLRESERSLQAPRAAEPLAPLGVSRPMPEDAKAVRVSVQRVLIEGDSLIPEAELQAQVAELVGQSLTLAELEHAAQRLAAYYRERGWYARVYLPEQDVTDGSLRIQVLEGRYDTSYLTVQAGQRANAAKVQRVITQRLVTGAPLTAAALERGLLLANDLPGIEAHGLLQACEEEHGHSDLLLTVQDTAFVTGDVGLNNHGIRSTGRAQAVGGLALNNLSGQGDQLALRLLASEGVRSAVARYSLPLGYDGLRLAAHGSWLAYTLGGSYRPLDAEGQARSAGLTLSYPLLRQSERNLTLSTGYEHRRYRDDMLGAALRRHDINALNLGLNGDLRDGFGGGGLLWGSAQLTHGRLAMEDIAGDRAQDAAGPRSRDNYTKLALQLGRVQSLGAGWQMQAALSGQTASGNLASSERMTLGGPSQVRAYPVNEADGDQGLLLKLELQRELGSGWQATAFYDTGRIRQHKRPWAGWAGGSSQPNSYSLSGLGLGVNWRGTGSLRGWQLAASVATPVGSNLGSVQGRNSDGSGASSTRGWLSLQRVF